MRILTAALGLLVIAGCTDTPTAVDGSGNDNIRLLSARGGGGGTTKINSVTVTPASASIQAGATVQLTATSKPGTASTFAWATTNASVATVSQSGLVTGVAAGTATISATATPGTSLSMRSCRPVSGRSPLASLPA